MKSKLVKLFKKPFVRNVAIVASGTASAQLLTMIFSPFITRIYGPEAYGILGVFLAVMATISSVAALTYPTAIVLPKNNKDAGALVYLSVYIAVFASIVTSLILWFYSEQIVTLLRIETIKPFLYLIPLVILFSTFLQVSKQWLMRTKQFALTARVEFIQALVVNSSKLGIGSIIPVASVLVVITTFGNFLHGLMLVLGSNISKYRDELGNIPSISQLKNIAIQYRDFPMLRSPQVFMNSVSSNLPVLLLTMFFGPVSAGFYTLARTVLNAPTRLIGKSIGDVFYPRIAEATHNGESIKNLVIKATLGLATIGVIPFGVVIVFGPWIFEIIFGTEWYVAGEYARWLAIWLFFMFINRPSVVAIPVLRMQGSFLIYEIISVLTKVLALFVGFIYFNDDILSIILFSITGSITYAALICWVIYSSKKFELSSNRNMLR